MKYRKLLGLLITLNFLSYQLPTYALDNSSEAIQKRIQPIGQVNINTESAAAPTSNVPSNTTQNGTTQQVDGKVVYESNCKLCHGTGVAGAPKVGDATAWKPHISKGLPTLLANATKGINAMPPRGGCVKCSNDEIMAAIKYMTDQSKN